MVTGNIKGISIEIGSDTSPLDKALKTVNKTSADLQKELKGVQQLLKLDPTNTTLLSQKQKLLADDIANTKVKLNALKQAEVQAQEAFKKGDISAEQYRNLQQSIIRTEQSLDKLEHQAVKTHITLDKVGEVSKKIATGAGSVAKGMAPVSAAILGIGVAATAIGFTYESAMSKVKAISSATGDEFEKLDALAMQLGADTAFSATEAANGMENLASAGFSVNEIMSAMPGMLDLAASGGLDVATASDIASSALRGFGLDAKESGHVADVLAQAAADTNANVTDMGMALKYAAPPAKALGMTIEEVSAAIGIMANAGIKGDQAGTTLRGSLISLASPSKEAADLMKDLGFNAFDAQGKMLPFKDVLDRLQVATKNLTQEKKADALATIFGKEALSGMMVVLDNGPAKFDELTQSLKDSDGAAQAMAETMLDNGKGSLDAMKGSIETVAITLSKILAPIVREIADYITNLANKFGALDTGTQKTILIVLGLVAAIAPLAAMISAIATVVPVVTGIIAAVSGAIAVMAGTAVAATPVIGALAGVLTVLTGPVGLIILGVAAIAAGFLIASAASRKATAEVKKLTDVTDASAKAFDEASKKVNVEAIVAGKLSDELYALADKENKSNTEKARMTSLVSQLNKLMPELSLEYDEQTGLLNQNKQAVYDLIASKQQELKLQAQEERILELYKEAATLSDAKTEAQKRLTLATEAYNTAKDSGKFFLKAEMDELQGATIAYDGFSAALVVTTGRTTEAETAYSDMATSIQKSSAEVVATAGETTASTTEQIVAQTAALGEQKENVATYMKELETATEKHLASMGGIEKKGIEKTKLTAAEVKANLLAQIKDFTDWQEGIQKLAARVPVDVMVELRKMGPQADPLIDEYNKMSDKKLAETVEIYRTKTALATSAAEEELSKMPGSAESIAADAGQGLADGLASKAEAVTTAAAGLANAATPGLNLYGTGANAGQGFADGLSSKKVAIWAAAGKLSAAAQDAMNKYLQNNSPSRVMAKIGSYASEGFALGLVQNLASVAKASGRVVSASVGVMQTSPELMTRQAINNTNSATYNQYVTIEKVVNDRQDSMKTLGENIGYYQKQQAMANGGA